MNRKFLAKVLAASLVLTATPALPGAEADAGAKELDVVSQEANGYLVKGISVASGGAVTDNPYAMGNVLSNPFEGKDTSNGVLIEFDVTSKGDAALAGVIFSFNDESKTLHFTSGSYLGVNLGDDGYFDANHPGWENADKLNDYIGSGGKVSIKITPVGFEVGVNDTKCYDQSVLATNGSGNLTDYSKILTFLAAEGSKVKFGSTVFDWPAAAAEVTSFKCSLIKADGSTEDINNGNPEPVETPEPTAPPTADKLDCAGYHTAFSGGYEVTGDGTTVTFDSETYADAIDAWNSPAVIVYSAEAPASHSINYDTLKDAAGFSELLYVRGDWWGEAKIGDVVYNRATFNEGPGTWMARGLPSDWSLFLASNKEGVKGEASAKYEDGKILVKFSVNGVTNLISIPYEKQEGKNIYLSLSGEKCKLSNIAESAFTGVTIPSSIATYPVNMPSPTPAPTLPPAGEDNGEGLELDCEGWWTAHTSGMEVTDSGVALTFKNNTYSAAANQWEVPVVVAYTGDEAKVNGAGYDEYAVIRGDAYAWTTKAADANTGAGLAAWNNLGYAFQSNASTFDTWLADNKAGTNCKVQAVKKDGKVIIETTVGSVTSYTTFPVDAGKKVYISLSGEKCKLTNIKTAQYTAINVPGETPSATATPAPSADPSATPAPDATATPDTDKPGTPDPGTTSNPGTQTPGTPETPEEPSKEDNKKKTMKVSGITAKAGKKKVTGTVSVKAAKVKVKVGSKKYKNAKVNGKKFTFTASSKLKKGTKITIKVTKSGYKTVTKSVKVK